jgi:hypothetical protein
VFALQLERTLLVVFNGVQGRLEALFVVTRGAIAAGGPSRELTLVNVPMTIRAERMRDLFTEIAASMAFKAGSIAMLSQ